MQTKDIRVNGKTAKGIEIQMPNAKLILAVAPKGYVICGYLNMETAEKLNDCAAVVTGVKTLDELLEKQVVKVSVSAQNAGIEPGMTGLEALAKMF